MCFAPPGLQRLARFLAIRSNSGALKFRSASGSGAPRFQPASALARKDSSRPQAPARQDSGRPWAPVGLGLPRAEVPAGLRLRRAEVPAGPRPRTPARRGSRWPRASATETTRQRIQCLGIRPPLFPCQRQSVELLACCRMSLLIMSLDCLHGPISAETARQSFQSTSD